MPTTTTDTATLSESRRRFQATLRELSPDQVEFLRERLDVLIADGSESFEAWNEETRRLIAEKFGGQR